jgi:hypothetical protein
VERQAEGRAVNLDERLAAIGCHLLGELIDEFPQWEIERENSGRYRAQH